MREKEEQERREREEAGIPEPEPPADKCHETEVQKEASPIQESNEVTATAGEQAIIEAEMRDESSKDQFMTEEEIIQKRLKDHKQFTWDQRIARLE